MLSPSRLGWKLSLESAPQRAPARGGYPSVVKHSLMIFADPESTAPDPGRSVAGTLYFGPGLHDLRGQLPIPASVTSIYVAGGAWVSGGFVTISKEATVVISGRGVISGTEYRFLKDPAGFGECQFNGSFCWSLVNMDRGASHRLEGVVLHDPPKFHFRSYAPAVCVHGVKMVGAWTPNSDGVVVGVGGLVSDSFIRSSDDSIKLFGNGSEVRDCTVWQMANGAVFQLGWWDHHEICAILVSRLTVLHADWRIVDERYAGAHATNDAVFDLRGPGGGTPRPPGPHPAGMYTITNITWRDLYIETPIEGGGLFRMNLSAASGTVRGLHFERLRVPSRMRSSVAETAEQWIGGFHLVDLMVEGSCARDLSAAGFSLAPPMNATFECSKSPARAASPETTL